MVAFPCQCKQCGYEWDSRLPGGNPRTCPRCRSFKWREEKSGKYGVRGRSLGTEAAKAGGVPDGLGGLPGTSVERHYEPVEGE